MRGADALRLTVLALVLTTLLPGAAGAIPLQAIRARKAIIGLELDEAAAILAGDSGEPEVIVEKGRLALYRGDCDRAVSLLQRPDLDELAAELLAVAQGCARGSAATVSLRDEARGVTVRFQDDEDRPLFPLIAETAAKVREVLAQDLGTRLPAPLYIDLVRDQLTLSAMSGLPYKAAQTTGTVAVAKWGRVIMLSPRATRDGYPWLDTLAHELAHLALSQATLDQAPLWLQEGMAKREERRWREPDPWDDFPSYDAVAAIGLQRGLGRPLTGLGASIAMLPSAEHARVAFAEVASFIDYWLRQAGPEALPKLLGALREPLSPDDDPASVAMADITGKTLAQWDAEWRRHLASSGQDLPPELAPGSQVARQPEVARRRRLGQLLLGRGHAAVAAVQLGRSHELLPTSATLRCHLAEALIAQEQPADAAPLVERPKDIFGATGRWWSLHRLLLGDKADPLALWRAQAIDPLSDRVACEELLPPELPRTASSKALCEVARLIPR